MYKLLRYCSTKLDINYNFPYLYRELECRVFVGTAVVHNCYTHYKQYLRGILDLESNLKKKYGKNKKH